MYSILITGANRGIGLELVKQLLAHPTLCPEILIATARNTLKAMELFQLATKNERLHILELDINNYNYMDKIFTRVMQIVGDKGLTVLFNNAGILEQKEGTLENYVRDETIVKQFNTNTVAPILLTKTFLPLLKKSAIANKDQKFGVHRAAVFYMSSNLASVAGNVSGEYWGYRESKAALNMAVRTISLEVKDYGVAVLILNPGWVKTDMGGKDALITPKVSVEGILKVMDALDEKTHGGFIDYTGKKCPW